MGVPIETKQFTTELSITRPSFEFRPSVREKPDVRRTPKIKDFLKETTRFRSRFDTGLRSNQISRQGQKVAQSLKTQPSQKTQLTMAPAMLIPPTTTPSTTTPTTVTPFGFTPPISPPPFLWFKGKPRPTPKRYSGYYPEAKAKGGKWIRLSMKPMSRQAALSRASKAVDNTTGQQFRLRGTKKKAELTGNGFDWGFRQNKFREYKIRRGAKITTPDNYIEKKSFAIDTKGEKEGLKLAKYAKQMGWLGKNKKKKSKRNIKKNTLTKSRRKK